MRVGSTNLLPRRQPVQVDGIQPGASRGTACEDESINVGDLASREDQQGANENGGDDVDV